MGNGEAIPQMSLRAKRSNPVDRAHNVLDCFASLAMTLEEALR